MTGLNIMNRILWIGVWTMRGDPISCGPLDTTKSLDILPLLTVVKTANKIWISKPFSRQKALVDSSYT